MKLSSPQLVPIQEAPASLLPASLSLLVSLQVMLVAALLIPNRAEATENYTGSVVGECVTYDDASYNVKATIGPGSPSWSVSMLSYAFSPVPVQLAPAADAPDGKTRYFSISPPGTYAVNVKDVTPSQGQQGTYSIVVSSCVPPVAMKGMTWRLMSTNNPTGTVRLGCANGECDPLKGDTPCTTKLPLLCIKKAGPGFPLQAPASVNNTSLYNKWSGGIVGSTGTMLPPATLAAANGMCMSEFGAGWRVAEFHDGWGWYFQAFGGVGDPLSRLWVHINDQPNAVCWK